MACDDCVPRGCSCNRELKEGIDYESDAAKLSENWIEQIGADGRKFPCCEWWYDVNGFEETVSMTDVLEASYQKSLTQDEKADKVTT